MSRTGKHDCRLCIDGNMPKTSTILHSPPTRLSHVSHTSSSLGGSTRFGGVGVAPPLSAHIPPVNHTNTKLLPNSLAEWTSNVLGGTPAVAHKYQTNPHPTTTTTTTTTTASITPITLTHTQPPLPPRSTSTISSTPTPPSTSSPLMTASQVATDQLTSEYHSLLSRVSLQSAQLSSLQAELASTLSLNESKDALVRACAKGLEGVWEKVQQQQHVTNIKNNNNNSNTVNSSQTPSSNSSLETPNLQTFPLSSAKVQAASFQSAHIHSSISALECGNLSGPSEVRALFASVTHELEGMLLDATTAVTQARDRAAEVARLASEQSKSSAHTLAETVDRLRTKQSQRAALHQWTMKTMREKLSDVRSRELNTIADSHVASRDARSMSGIFHTWLRCTERKHRATTLGQHAERHHRLKLLRSAYFLWRLRLLQQSRDAAVILKTKLSETMSSETLDQPGRTSMKRTFAWFTWRHIQLWRERLCRKETLIRQRHFQRIFQRWYEASSQRTSRNRLLGRLLQRSFERKKMLALKHWSSVIQSFRTRRIHTLASLCEGIELRLASQRLSKLHRGWKGWFEFVRTSRLKDIKVENDVRYQEMKDDFKKREFELQHDYEMRLKLKEDEIDLIRQHTCSEVEAAREDMKLEMKQFQKDVEMRSEQGMMKKSEECSKRILEMETLVTSLKVQHETELQTMKLKYQTDLDSAHDEWRKEKRVLQDEIDDLHLTQKHVVLEMKHQEHVHADWKRQEGRRPGGRGTGGVHDNFSGVTGHLGTNSVTTQPTICVAAAPAQPQQVHITQPAVCVHPSAAVPTVQVCGPHYPGSMAPPVHVDPYLNSPVYHHHITKELTTAHKSELDAARLLERELRTEISSLHAQLTKVRGAYVAEHKALKSLQSSQTEALLVSHSKLPQEQLTHLKELQTMKEELIHRQHALELCQVDLQGLQRYVEELEVALKKKDDDFKTQQLEGSSKDGEFREWLQRKDDELRKKDEEYMERLTKKDEEFGRLKDQMNQECDELQQRHQHELSELHSQLLSTQQCFEQRLLVLKQQHSEEVSQLRKDHNEQLSVLRSESSQLLEKLETSSRDSLETLRRDHLVSDGRLEQRYEERLKSLEENHLKELKQIEAKHQQEQSEWLKQMEALRSKHSSELQTEGINSNLKLETCQTLLQTKLDTLQRELEESHTELENELHKFQKLESDYEAEKKVSSKLQNERMELLERNRKLAAALIENSHHSAGLTKGRQDDHTHLGINEAAILSSNIHAANVLASAPRHMRTSATTTTGTSNAAASGFKPVRASPANRLGDIDSDLDVGAGGAGSYTQHGLLGFGALPASSTRLSLTPVTQLAFSPPATPPIGGVGEKPWPKPQPQNNEDHMAIGAPETEEQEEETPYGGLLLGPTPHRSPSDPFYFGSLTSPTGIGSLRSPPPTSFPSRTGGASGWAAASSSSSSILGGAPIAATYRPTTSSTPFLSHTTQQHQSYSAAPRTRMTSTTTAATTTPGPNTKGGSGGVTAQQLNFVSPRMNTSGVDVSSLFQRGLTQHSFQ